MARARTSGWTPGTGPNDRRLSGLTPAATQRVRDLARRALAERGLETVVHADHLRTADGRMFGLENIASVCHNAKPTRWAELIADHLDALLGQFPSEPPELSAPQIRAGAHLRLVPMDAVRSLGAEALDSTYGYARRIGGDMLEMLVHADGPYVRWLTDADVAKVGFAELHAIGRKSLLNIEPDSCEVLRRPRSELHVVRGGSGFVASKLLVLDAVLPILLGHSAAWEHGVLVAVPSRHELVLAPIDANVVSNLVGLLEIAALEYRNEIAPLSPFVYWWQDGVLVALSEADEHGCAQLVLPEEFRAAVAPLLREEDVA